MSLIVGQEYKLAQLPPGSIFLSRCNCCTERVIAHAHENDVGVKDAVWVCGHLGEHCLDDEPHLMLGTLNVFFLGPKDADTPWDIEKIRKMQYWNNPNEG